MKTIQQMIKVDAEQDSTATDQEVTDRGFVLDVVSTILSMLKRIFEV